MKDTVIPARRGPRGRSLCTALILGALAVTTAPSVAPSLAAKPATQATINVGTKNFAEEYVIADIYRLLLQKAGFNVPAYHDLATTPVLQNALRKGQIDLYPEYTGTGLEIVLHHTKAITDPITAYDTVKTGYRKFGLTWLEQAPMNDTNGVGVTQATVTKYHLTTLSDLAKAANKLTFAALAECKDRPDCLGGLQSVYGVHFKSVKYVEAAPVRYTGLKNGTYDAVEVFTTDGPIKALNLKVLTDNKHIFPADHIAPVIRTSILNKYPKVRGVLNKVAPLLTTQTMIQLNVKAVLNGQDPLVVARGFLHQHHLI